MHLRSNQQVVDGIYWGFSFHPFTAPAVSPRTNCFWNTTKTIKIGTAAMIVPAMIKFGLSRSDDAKSLKPVCKVFMSSSVVMSDGHKY